MIPITLAAIYKNCDDIKKNNARYNPNRNNIYAVDPDSASGEDIFGVRCDFRTDRSIGISVVSYECIAINRYGFTSRDFN